MYIQKFVKGISGKDGEGLSWLEARSCIDDHLGIPSNWLRKKGYSFDPAELIAELTDLKLDRHVHDYATFGAQSPFVSLGAGCIERDVLLSANYMYSARDTALDFATNAFEHPGTLFYGWVIVALNPTVEVAAVAESIRDLNVYHRWSPYQLEGEITAKVQVPANQIDRIEWWDPQQDTAAPADVYDNPDYTSPTRIINLREFF